MTALLLTYSEAAKRLSVSPRTVRRMVEANELPRVKIGARLVRIAEQALTDFIKRRNV